MSNVWGAVAQAAGSLIGGITSTAMNINAQNKANQGNINNDWKMWHMTNWYNHPLSQVMRLKQAGLNPNLAYGNGVQGNIASQGKMSDMKAPQVDSNIIGNAISTYQDARLKQAQIDNMEMQRDVMDADIRVKNADVGLKLANTSKSQFDVKKGETLLSAQADAAKLYNDNLSLRNVEQTIKNSQLPEKHQQYLLESASRIALNASYMTTQELQQQLLREEAYLKQRGLTYSDSFLKRIFAPIIPNRETREKWFQEAKDWGEKQFKNFHIFGDGTQNRKQ